MVLPPGDRGAGPAPGLQLPGEALDVAAADGEQGQRMGADTGHDQQHDVGCGYSERDFQNSCSTSGAMGVHVHFFSLRGAWEGFKSARWAAGVGR